MILMCCIAIATKGQVGINDNNTAPDPSAMLDVNATSKGFLAPRLTKAQMNAIVNPAEGLLVFCTDCSLTGTSVFAGFMNGAWTTFDINCVLPAVPAAGSHVPAVTQIIWNWNAVSGATGYKWSATNNFSTATDMGAATTKTETGLTCNTPYTRYAWAYKACGNSSPVTLTKSTSTDPPAAPASGTHVASSAQIIWNWNAVAGAAGYKWSTTNNYATATDMGLLLTKTETGLNSGTPYTRFVWAYNSCGVSTATTLQQTTLAPCGSTVTVNHVAGVVTPVSKSVTYSTVTNIPGETTKCWIAQNLGSSQQATAVNDGSEASAGWYWQFNRKQGFKHDGSNRTPATAWISSINESSDWNPVNDPCTIELGALWRIPTSTEWNNVDVAGGWTNWNGPFSSQLKLHAAGNLSYMNGSLDGRGVTGYYYSITQQSTTHSYCLTFINTASYIVDNYKPYATPLRCLRSN